jgi:hypothetical protein
MPAGALFMAPPPKAAPACIMASLVATIPETVELQSTQLRHDGEGQRGGRSGSDDRGSAQHARSHTKMVQTGLFDLEQQRSRTRLADAILVRFARGFGQGHQRLQRVRATTDALDVIAAKHDRHLAHA